MFSISRTYFLAATAVLAVAISGRAAEVSWVGITDDWNTAENWSPLGAPTTADTAIIGAVETEQLTIALTGAEYELTGLSFVAGMYALLPADVSTMTITGGALSSTSTNGDFNWIGATVEMTAADNTISVGGDADHELQVNDLNVFGSLTTDVSNSLCLAGVTTVTGAFVKAGVGHTCTEGGLTAASTSVQGGEFMVESNSSLGATTVSAGATMSVVFSSTATVSSIETAGLLQMGANDGSDDVLVAAGGVTVQNDGTLAGLGRVEADVTVEAGGSVAAGMEFGTGVLTIEGELDFEVNSIAAFTILAENQLQGWLSVEGDVTLEGFLSMNDTGAEGLYTLIEFTGTRFGAFAGTFDTLAGYNYELIYNANSVQLEVTAVPEPTTWALLGLGGAVVWLGRRRVGASLQGAKEETF